MNKKAYMLFPIFFFTLTHISASPYTINMFVRDYPEEQLEQHPRTINPLQINKQRMKTYFYQPVSRGTYALYNGLLTHSNEYGLLSFPRETQIEEFTGIVTESIIPHFLVANTISHWTIKDETQTEFYLIKRNKDPETKIMYWKTQKLNIPDDKTVPLHAIIILAKPEDVYVPLGTTPTTDLPNLLLPSIYVKRGLDHLKQASFILNIKQFFAPVSTMTKADKATIMTLVYS